MKHVIPLLFATVGCSQPPQRSSAFDPEVSTDARLESVSPSLPPLEPALVEALEPPSEGSGRLSDESNGSDRRADDNERVVTDEDAFMAVTVRAGESLDRLSRWSAASVEQIAARNDLDITAPLVPGQVLQVPIADLEAFESSRSGALERRLERYLAANGGLAGIEGYTVRTGDTAWAIAKHVAGVPAWVLAAFNGGESLDHLAVGATLYLPIMTQVAETEEPMDELPSDGFGVVLEGEAMDSP